MDLVGDQDDVDDRQYAGDDRDHGLRPHDQVEPEHPAGHDQYADHDQRDHLRQVPPPQPSRSNTVAVASVARIVSTVSQPTVSNQDTSDGSLLPRTPNAARLSTIVGAEPRLPASAISPQSRNENTIPISAGDHRLPERDPEAERERAVAQAQHRDVRPEPGPEQLTRPALRSSSAITFSPLLSTASARVSAPRAGQPWRLPTKNEPVQSCSITVGRAESWSTMNFMLSEAVDGFRLAYDRAGEGPAVILLHGWPGDRTDYRLLAPMLVERGV